MNKNYPNNSALRYGFVLVAILSLLQFALTTQNTLARPQTQEGGEGAQANQIFLPMITNANRTSFQSEVAPLDATQYEALSEEAPTTAPEGISASACQTYIRFTNNSSSTVKIYWVNSSNQETLYYTLSAGAAYWQHSFFGYSWVVRSLQGNQLKQLTVATCLLIYVNIENSDFPPGSTTPTNTPLPPTATRTNTPVAPTATNTPVTQPPFTCPGNLLINPDFENGFASWTVAGYTSQQLTLSNNAASGAQAALLRGPGGIFISQPIAVLAGANYSLTGFGKTTNPAIFHSFGINFYDVNGTRLDRFFAQVTSSSYQQVSGAMTAPVGTNFIEVFIYTDGGADFLADAVCVTRSGGPTPTNTPSADNVTIGDRVWVDANRNGVQDEGGSGLANVTIDLLEGCTSTTAAATKVTSNSGQYVFTNLAPGQYRIRVALPGGYLFTLPDQGDDEADSDVDSSGVSGCITLAPSVANFSVDAVYDPNAPIPTPTPTPTPIGGYIGDRVWNDLDRNGIQDSGEPGLAGVTVELLQGCSGINVIATLTTSNSGQYLFRDLPPGQFLVRVVAPAGLVFSPQNTIVDDAGDSDVDSNGITPCITQSPFEEESNVDAGLYNPQGTIPTATPTPTPAGGLIGDRVWNDFTQDGVQNAGEPGVQGVTVDLLAGCTDTTVLATRITNNRGEYAFTALAAGDYRVRVTALSGYVFSPKNAIADPFADSNVDGTGVSNCITLAPFAEIADVDAGIYDPSAPPPTATNTPIPATATNTPVPPTPTFTPTNTPLPSTATSTNTPVPPTPTFTPVPPTATNTPVLATATPTNTPAPGCNARVDRIRFVNLNTNLPVAGYDPIPNGASINLATLPALFAIEVVVTGATESIHFLVNDNAIVENFTPFNYPATGAAWNPSAGSYTVTAAAYGQDNKTGPGCDAKQVAFTFTGSRLASVGDRVWNDLNRNGTQDANEPNVANIVVDLWIDSDNNGAHDTKLASMTTNASGNYLFAGLEPGRTYVVKFPLPSGLNFTTANVGSDSSDSDVSFLSYSGTATFTLNPAEVRTTVDAGVYYTYITLAAQHSGKCLDVPNGSTQSGVQLQQYSCNGTGAQQFKLLPVSGTSDLFTLVNRNSNLCLDIYNSSQSDGAKLIQWSCTGNTNQQFRLQGVSTGIYKVLAKHSNKCVEVKSSSQSNSALIQQGSCTSGANQQWKVGN